MFYRQTSDEYSMMQLYIHILITLRKFFIWIKLGLLSIIPFMNVSPGWYECETLLLTWTMWISDDVHLFLRLILFVDTGDEAIWSLAVRLGMSRNRPSVTKVFTLLSHIYSVWAPKTLKHIYLSTAISIFLTRYPVKTPWIWLDN